MMPLDQARSDDANNARVPPLAGNDQARRLAQLIRQVPQCRLGFVCHLPLRGAPLAIGPTQLIGDLCRPNLVLRKKQLDPSIRTVEPSRSIDSRRKLES